MTYPLMISVKLIIWQNRYYGKYLPRWI